MKHLKDLLDSISKDKDNKASRHLRDLDNNTGCHDRPLGVKLEVGIGVGVGVGAGVGVPGLGLGSWLTWKFVFPFLRNQIIRWGEWCTRETIEHGTPWGRDQLLRRRRQAEQSVSTNLTPTEPVTPESRPWSPPHVQPSLYGIGFNHHQDVSELGWKPFYSFFDRHPLTFI